MPALARAAFSSCAMSAVARSGYQARSSSAPISNSRSASRDSSAADEFPAVIIQHPQVTAGGAFAQAPDTLHVVLALHVRQHPAGIEQVEGMRCLHDHLVRRVDQVFVEQPARFALERVEQAALQLHVRSREVVMRMLHLEGAPQFGQSDAGTLTYVESVAAVLQLHCDALKSVGQFDRHRPAVLPTDLLEVSELGDLHAVHPHFPAEPPGTERGGFPVVLHETDVMRSRVDADRTQRIEVQLLDVKWRGLQDDLVLEEVLEAVRVLPVAAVNRPAAGSDARHVPAAGTERPQEGGRVEGARSDLGIGGDADDAAVIAPEAIQPHCDILESHEGSSGKCAGLRDASGHHLQTVTGVIPSRAGTAYYNTVEHFSKGAASGFTDCSCPASGPSGRPSWTDTTTGPEWSSTTHGKRVRSWATP